jgi:hypothetical protein
MEQIFGELSPSATEKEKGEKEKGTGEIFV